MIGTEYAKNRAVFPNAKLAPYRGQWVSFSPDGREVIAAAPTLAELESRLLATGHDPQQVVYEQVPETQEDIYVGGAEFLGC